MVFFETSMWTVDHAAISTRLAARPMRDEVVVTGRVFRVSLTLDRSSLFAWDGGHDLLLGSAVWIEGCGEIG